MSNAYKPAGYPSVSPYLLVRDAPAVIAFLKAAFGAETLRTFTSESGGIIHAELRIDDSVVMLGERPEGWQPVEAHVHMYVPDVDAAYQSAVAAGADPVQVPVNQDDEDMRGGVKGPGGTTWWISTRVG